MKIVSCGNRSLVVLLILHLLLRRWIHQLKINVHLVVVVVHSTAFHLHYGTKVYDKLKFDTSNEEPDTPQLYFGENEAGESQFYLIGPGRLKVRMQKTRFKPLEITGPGLKVVDGKIQLVKDKALGFGFKTQQTYIYKRERKSDEIKSN